MGTTGAIYRARRTFDPNLAPHTPNLLMRECHHAVVQSSTTASSHSLQPSLDMPVSPGCC